MNTYIRAELCHWHCGKIRVTSIQAKWTVNTITVELSTSKLSMGFKQWQSNSLLKRRIKSCWFQKSLNSAKILQFWVVGIIVWITDFYSQYQVSCPQERWPWHMAEGFQAPQRRSPSNSLDVHWKHGKLPFPGGNWRKAIIFPSEASNQTNFSGHWKNFL